jgi:hypothetical protein
MLDELKQYLKALEEQEHGTIFEAGQALGEIVGRKNQISDLIRKLEEDRKVVDIAGKPAETAAKGKKPEKR